MSLQISDYEKKKFEIFKRVYEIGDNFERTRYINSLCSDVRNLRFLSTMYKADILRIIDLDTQKIREEYGKIVYELYPNLLSKMRMLADELKLHSSLELSMLCEFLMKEGYLSKNQELQLQQQGRMCMRGMFFLDIITGAGVCSNLAALERDFLNYCGYNASVMYNYMPSSAVGFYESDEYKNNFNSSQYKRSFWELIRHEVFKMGNHMFTIIEDNGRLYAYDPANTIILELPNHMTAQIITGFGTCRMKLYLGIKQNNGLPEIKAIEKLFERTDTKSPYSNNDFCHTLFQMNDLVLANKPLFEDFYADSKPYIDSIAQESAKINVKRKYEIIK